jgi:hypothetical protein
MKLLAIPAQRANAVERLRKIIRDYPGTEAADDAKQLLRALRER